MGVVVGLLFLEETHAEKKYRRDIGLEAGRWLVGKARGCTRSKQVRCEKAFDASETQSLIDELSPPGYRTTEGSPQYPQLIDSQNRSNSNCEFIPIKVKPATSKAFTKQVVLNIVGYGILA